MTDVPVGLLVTIAIAAVLLAAALSAGEVAILRLTRADAAELIESRPTAAARLRRVTGHPARTARAAAFVRLISEMTATTCVAIVVASGPFEWWQALLVALAIGVVLALGFVRLSPRSLGRSKPRPTVVALAPLLSVVERVAGAVSRIAPEGTTGTEVDEEELRTMVQRVRESEVIEEEERELFRSVLELGDTLTREVMVPRTDMVTTAATTPLRKALALLLRSGYSRVPVIGESVDDLRGVLYLKDVVQRLQVAPEAADAPVSSVARPPVFVPESKPVDDLLRELQEGSSHLAMVVDEYGGIAGLVTIEDALEEIVGELTDEHDRSGPEVEDLGDGTFRVPARLPRDQLGELFDLDVEDDDVDSAGGLLTKAIGKVPIPGATGDIHGLHLVAERTEGRRRRLATLIVSLSAPGATDTSEERPATPAAADETHGATR